MTGTKENKIISGLNDALAFARGDKSAGSIVRAGNVLPPMTNPRVSDERRETFLAFDDFEPGTWRGDLWGLVRDLLADSDDDRKRIAELEAKLADARANALEEAAKVAEATIGYDDDLQRSAGCLPVGERIAASIRALAKPKEHP